MSTVAVGAFLDNGRGAPATTYDGLFAYVTTSFDAAKVFSRQP
jgi:hypothetical protein